MPAPKTDLFAKNVFINCPFDDPYREFFRAILFTVLDCGFVPRCAREASDSGQVRIDKILAIIDESRFGIHDISRTELDTINDLPRFNMPLELGLFLGSKRFGSKQHKTKSCIIFDSADYRYQKFTSDIAGQDIASHDNKISELIQKLRDWLDQHMSDKILPGGDWIFERFETFCSDLPAICENFKLKSQKLTFKNLIAIIEVWLERDRLLLKRF